MTGTAFGGPKFFAPMPWKEHAACKFLGPNEFYPEQHKPKPRIVPVIAVCQGCPVRQECLDYALENNEVHGIWGGMTVLQRRAEKRERAKSVSI